MESNFDNAGYRESMPMSRFLVKNGKSKVGTDRSLVTLSMRPGSTVSTQH